MVRRHALVASALLALAGCSGGSPRPPALTTFVAAELVLGQPDLTSGSPDRGGAVTAGGVHHPVGDAQAHAGGLVLPDTYNHRLLVYRAMPNTSGAAADAVLGQADASASAPSHAAGRLHYPRSVGSTGDRLLVADTEASRVVLGAGAGDVPLGWGDASPAYRWGCAADRLSGPSRAFAVSGRLIVADRANHRVLVWNQLPTGGAPADLVIGQKNLTHCAPNDMVGEGVPGGRAADTLHHPTDVWSDGTRLVVVDQGNNRVLLWNRFPTASGTKADLVLGQPDFLVARAEASRTGMSWPAAVASDGKGLFVADARNHRVLAWRAFPTASGAPADLVLGQSDFVHGAPNDDDQDGVAGGPTGRTLNLPMGLALAGDTLVVTDTGNHRFLLFKVR